MPDDWDQDKPADVVSPLGREFAQLTARLLDADTVAEALDHVVRATFAVQPDAAVVSVTLRSADGHLHTPADTDPVAVELDRLQERYGHGPCLEAAKEKTAYKHSGNLADEPTWPLFGPDAAALGFCSVLSTSLLPDAIAPRLSGALNIYSRQPGKFSDDTSRDRALLLATHASLALAHTEAVRLAELREAQMRRAIDSRDVIGQAKGILMQRRGIDADEAFDQLRRISQDLNVKLAQLAQTLATRHTEIDLPEG